MTQYTKQKHVIKEVLEDFVLPGDGKEIVRVIASCGNNLHEVENALSDHYLVSMPTKFRKTVWIKRGDFVLTEPIAEGNRVKAEIFAILYKEQIKYIKERKLWPAVFDDLKSTDASVMIPDDMLPPESSDESDDEGSVEDSMEVVNPNRPTPAELAAVYGKNLESDSEGSEEEGDKTQLHDEAIQSR